MGDNMNDSGILTAEEVNEKFLNVILNRYRERILDLMKKIDAAALNGNQGLGWDIGNIKEQEYYSIITFLKRKGFEVIIDKEKNLVNILW